MNRYATVADAQHAIDWMLKELIALNPAGEAHYRRVARLPVRKRDLEDGEPCGPGCQNHVSHPCEECGRIQARGRSAVLEWRSEQNKEKPAPE